MQELVDRFMEICHSPTLEAQALVDEYNMSTESNDTDPLEVPGRGY